MDSRFQWSMSLVELVGLSDVALIRHLQKMKILQKLRWCPHCKSGRLWPLKQHAGRGPAYRCRARGCQKFVLPHAGPPFFACSWGSAHVPLRTQAMVLFCCIARVDMGKIHILTSAGRKVVETLCRRWRQTLVRYVEHKQSQVCLGEGLKWSECEVDEVTCRGRRVGQKVTWYQYCGLLKRGDRRTLVLAKMKVKTTSVKLKGKGAGSTVSPGPITKAEWKKIADKYVKLRKVLLHCDGARAYKFSNIPGVVTDAVKHKRPKPIYSMLKKHVLPKDQLKAHVKVKSLPAREKEVVWVKTGTQLIDNCWRQLRAIGLPKSTKAEDQIVNRRVREFQWHHWNAEADKWAEAGHVFSDSHVQRMCRM